jgi:hypothetical protein
MGKYLTKKQVMELFRREVLPAVRRKFETDGKVDRLARSEEWNNYTDYLRKSDKISEKAYDTWDCPF